MKKFQFAEGRLSRTLRKKKKKQYRKLTEESRTAATNIFVRTNDTISTSPIIWGDYDLVKVKFFEWCSENDYDDFFIDIGANIGLLSCLSSHLFKAVHSFEPNPLAFKIFEVNAASYNANENIFLNNFGLGVEDTEAILTVPRSNWGGAFIEDENNSYSKELLAAKDGFDEIAKISHQRLPVKIKNGEEIIQTIIHQTSEVAVGGIARGVIKIDVEGYEKVILEQIAKGLKDSATCFIIFENWQRQVDLSSMLSVFQRPTKISILDKKPPMMVGNGQSIEGMWRRVKQRLRNVRCEYALFDLDPTEQYEDLYGELVIYLPPKT